MGTKRIGIKSSSLSSIEISFTYRGVQCRERIKLKPTPANLDRAANHRSEIIRAIESDTFDYLVTFPESVTAQKISSKDGNGTLEQYLKVWLARQQKHIKDSTYDGYRKIVTGHLNPWLGHLKLVEIRKKDIREQLDAHSATNKTLANIQSVLRKALSDAVDDELIELNPLAGWCYSKIEAPKTEDDINPFSAEERSIILAHAEGQGRNLLQFAFWTGMRTSEMVALNWSDIDFDRGIIKVTRAMTQKSKSAEGTKTTSGKRDIKLLSDARKALESQKEYTLRKGEEVFQNPETGLRWAGDQPIRKQLWTKVLKAGNVDYRRPYQTRHTYASMLLNSGEPPMWVATQMGHADWTMIAKIYGRWMPDADASVGKKTESKYSSDSELDSKLNQDKGN